MEDKVDPIFGHCKRIADAVTLLRDHGQLETAIMVLYAGIDQLVWLSVPEEEAGGKGFKKFVQTYMLQLPDSNLSGVSADDLWGARCGVLHTGAPESRESIKNGAKHIYYSTMMGPIEWPEPGAVVVSLELLTIDFARSGLYFIADIEKDAARSKIAREKLRRMLSFHKIDGV